MKSFGPCVIAFLVALALGVSSSSAAIVGTNEINDDPLFYDSGITTSLITAGQASLSGAAVLLRAPDGGFAAGGVNDGKAVGATGGTTDQTTLTFFNDLTTPNTVTFKLTGSYRITSVRSLAGWNDTFFGSQSFTVGFETANSGVFVPLAGTFGTQGYTGSPPPGSPTVADAGFATRTTITEDTTGTVATNVTGVRFTYSDPYPALTGFNGIVIRELSVFGTPVPEPASLAGISLAACGLLSRRREVD